ncbi:LVIVD repeat-containing protein [Spirosoma pollinicola]|uniref:LVIVD repeat-containing protein n=1 Tax=Spirosoma pollinicola TaxID=2057025 RepID=A0A2K8Z1X9_9BACT|nr:hypothetical protein [Spirosoma pollinicola]AUD03851.1 hypothetical protein CWM47_19685 [Spirosoma pollinicola]
MQRLLRLLTLPIILGLLDSCGRPYAPNPPTTGDTYRPVYAAYSDVRSIQTLGPQPIKNAGKIYRKDDYLFINDRGSGIHILDNRIPEKPVKLAFIAILGNQELAIKDSILYADNITDLVALNIANPLNVRLVKRIENAFEYSAFPLATNVRFECADRSRGVVVRWEKIAVENPQCYR